MVSDDDRVYVHLGGLENFEYVCALLMISGARPLYGTPSCREFSITNAELTPKGLAALLRLEGADEDVHMTGLRPTAEQRAEADAVDIGADLDRLEDEQVVDRWWFGKS
ncbi:hypothetical protein ACSNOI_03265 [Actinomadura kijaniata]|uniref:hypothetical protein n=1 Tax=Actinomadura kijaniata TaxID=46161 RepID=UPI003F1D4919